MQDLHRKLFETDIAGAKVTLEVSDLAKQANGAVLGTYGETVVLATVVQSRERAEKDFFPLTVDYEERFYAIGKILGSRYVRREGRPSPEATLSARRIDRIIRPLFDQSFRYEVHVVVTVLAYDGEHDPNTIALIATSAALGISDIPWNGPVGCFERVSADEGGAERRLSFAGPKGLVNMIEFEGREVPEEELIGYFEEAQREIDRLATFQETIIGKAGKEKRTFERTELDEETKQIVTDTLSFIDDPDAAVLHLITALREKEKPAEVIDAALTAFEDEAAHSLATLALTEGKRADGRQMDEVRELYAETGLLARTHGSAVFARGDTHVLSVTTLAPISDALITESIEHIGKQRFLLHYNFPSFSTGEVGRGRSTSRREIGHGNLAWSALHPLIPAFEEFPYTIRAVAETLSSNGSSSMATVCATSLSLMDAGVPLPEHVAGIAMGFLEDRKSGKRVILTDIQGPEDHYGFMDLKVAGTTRGITAIQMDTKVPGIDRELFAAALPRARAARLTILELLTRTLPQHRPELSPYAPIIMMTSVPQDRIGEIIGPGGRTINRIGEEAGNDTRVDIEEDGTVSVSGMNRASVQKAIDTVTSMVREYQVGDVVEGTVVRLLDFGAIVDLGGNQSGMIHVSEMADTYVEHVSDILKEGDHVRAKVIKVDRDNDKIGLSLKNVPN